MEGPKPINKVLTPSQTPSAAAVLCMYVDERLLGWGTDNVRRKTGKPARKGATDEEAEVTEVGRRRRLLFHSFTHMRVQREE